jgi:serine/threonine-protein kinase RsbW
MSAPFHCSVRAPGHPESGVEAEVALRLPSDVNWVGEAVELLCTHCFAGQPVPPSSRTAFRLRMALAEALCNAIRAGNREDPTKHVTVVAELFPERIRISVCDEGDGFDPECVPEPTTLDAVEREGGRGLFIIRNMADQVEFNERGNTIWMTLPRC